MFDSTALITFLGASIAIILAPGPAQALVLTRAIGEGRAAGAMTAVGLNVGTLAHAFAAALGLSAILATSAVAFGAVKYVGAAYLIYLGIRALRAQDDNPERVEGVRTGAMFWRAVVTGVLNPKVAVFFLAFLPQFVAPERGSAFWQFVILGVIVAALDVVYELILVWAVGALRGRMLRSRRFAQWRQRITGAALIGLGARLAFP
jgi:threonine/homoserine/homoserine lactone efflux protein